MSHRGPPRPTSGASCLPETLLPPQISVTFGNDGFEVKLPDGHQLTFPNRLGHSHLSYLSVLDGLSVSSFKIN